MHRLSMLSNTYRCASVRPRRVFARIREIIPHSHDRRRLDSDAIRDHDRGGGRDAQSEMGGVGVIPPLTSEEILAARMAALWPENPDPSSTRDAASICR